MEYFLFRSADKETSDKIRRELEAPLRINDRPYASRKVAGKKKRRIMDTIPESELKQNAQAWGALMGAPGSMGKK